MPSVFGIPLIGFIQMVLGTAIIVFLAIKFLKRPKKNKKGEYIIKDVHIIVGNGDEASHQYVYIKGGKIEEISDIPIEKKNVQIIDGTGKTLMPGLIDSHIHIQARRAFSPTVSRRSRILTRRSTSSTSCARSSVRAKSKAPSC